MKVERRSIPQLESMLPAAAQSSSCSILVPIRSAHPAAMLRGPPRERRKIGPCRGERQESHDDNAGNSSRPCSPRRIGAGLCGWSSCSPVSSASHRSSLCSARGRVSWGLRHSPGFAGLTTPGARPIPGISPASTPIVGPARRRVLVPRPVRSDRPAATAPEVQGGLARIHWALAQSSNDRHFRD